jgi:hypothetical protein
MVSRLHSLQETVTPPGTIQNSARGKIAFKLYLHRTSQRQFNTTTLKFCKAFGGIPCAKPVEMAHFNQHPTQRVTHLLPVECEAFWMLQSQCYQKLNRIVYLQNSDFSQDQITQRNYVLNAAHIIKSCEKNVAKSMEMPNKGVSRIK